MRGNLINTCKICFLIFQTKVFMPKFFKDSFFQNITGKVLSEFVNDKGVYGKATISLYGRENQYADWKYIEEQHIIPVSN